ncbi:hypothetical protein C1645_536058 [Glomus cerebriforme]|uniref:Uncharacterized protein n=1 Tax=Glomus cerebriforme TaxID=658196 RepID=A0A397SBZ4_9GLOM|nr:hypothetical protein C1645_536058 [Glomus cerebriforme]
MANTTSKLQFVIDMLSDFSPIKFYKKYGGYKLRKEVERDLLAQLKMVEESGSTKQACKAKQHITNFNDTICSTRCEGYWDDRDMKMAQKRTEKRKSIHDYHIEYNVYREHDAHSSRITNATEKDDVSPTKKNLNDEINNFFQSPSEQKSTNPIKRRRESGIFNANNEEDKKMKIRDFFP